MRKFDPNIVLPPFIPVDWSTFGRTISSHGYVRIKFRGHPFADVAGYVYEHRLIMENKLGRYLLPHEQVHHDKGKNNDPDNLIFEKSLAHHKVAHRKIGCNRRLPDEPNEEILCGCGCGSTLLKYDNSGRLRKHIHGHKGVNNINNYRLCECGCGFRTKNIHTAYKKEHALDYQKVEIPIITCLCGCGTKMNKFDKYGRVRKYISGHNSVTELHPTQIPNAVGLSYQTIVNYFNNKKLRIKTVQEIEDYLLSNNLTKYVRQR